MEVELIDDNQEIVLSNEYYGVRAVYIADLEARAESWCYETCIYDFVGSNADALIILVEIL